VCLYTLSRLNDRNLREACHSLTEIYNWQREQSRLPAPAPTTHVRLKTKPHKITHTKRKPFSFEE
jgi:hypothetical protein